MRSSGIASSASPARCYAFNGNATPSQQAGLSFDNTGPLVTHNNYSIELVFEFSQNSGWRRILDVQNRQSDNGFYVDPSSHLDVFPVAAGSTTFTSNAYHYIALTDASSGTIKAYLDGGLEFTANSTLMDVNNPQNLVNFFLDNTVGGGQGKYSSGRVALIRLTDGVLTDADVRERASNPFLGAPTIVPAPSSLLLLESGIITVLAFGRRARRP
jgi:hypothetical protein